MDDTGYHYIVDLKVESNALLRDPLALKSIFVESLRDFTVVGYDHHKFEGGGGGVTGFFLLSESHCSYHTYPESNYIAVDVFTCGRDPGDFAPDLATKLGALSYTLHFLKRGSVSIPVTQFPSHLVPATASEVYPQIQAHSFCLKMRYISVHSCKARNPRHMAVGPGGWSCLRFR
ncbi:adenosylmethionine decarboxylase [Verminephrobacter eiseniae]|uniref:adenosylmethionine decarboxylase n=1 Tax=Verminephrobacter eiseniae TaxID=364317 RepID=UPI002238ADE1|nr:adenosylmethionine decarboxylase [Verminephrobacter eiseniae]MCW5238055.1 adenosylmethionine decarboxylase [Verminephrobacter eiseniae]